MPTWNAGSSTLTLNETQGAPCTLDSVVSTIANTAFAQKLGDSTYLFQNFTIAGGNGWIRFAPDTVTILRNVAHTRSGSTGGVIHAERSVVRFEGTFNTGGDTANSNAGYTFRAIRDRAGVNPRLILAHTGRYDFFSGPFGATAGAVYDISGLDLESQGSNSGVVAASNKVVASTNSTIANLRVLSRSSPGVMELLLYRGTVTNLWLEASNISTNADPNQTITLDLPTYDFRGVASPLGFNFNAINTIINVIDPTFIDGAWNGNYFGYATGWRNSATCVVNVVFTDTYTFLEGVTPRVLTVRHTRNDGVFINTTANASGVISRVQLLTSVRTGSGFAVGTAGPSATYTWSAKARAYDFRLGGSDTIYASKSFSARGISTLQCVPVPSLTLTQAQAAALTGIAFVPSGAANGTVTVTQPRTAQELWQFYRQWIATPNNFGSDDSWLFANQKLSVGSWSLTATATITGTITLSSGALSGTLANGVSYTYTGGTLSQTTAAPTFDGGALTVLQPGQFNQQFLSATTLICAAAGTYDFRQATILGTVTLVNTSGGAVTVQIDPSISFVNSGPNITVDNSPPPVYQSVTVTNGVAGSRLLIQDITTPASPITLYSGVPASFPHTWTDPVAYVADRDIRVRAAYQSGTSAKLFVDEEVGTVTLASPALSYRLNQQDDTVYQSNAIDGSTVTGITIDDPTMLINVSTSTISLPSIYAYETYWLATAAGIIDEGRIINATDTANYVFKGGWKIKNTSSPSAPLTITGGYMVDAATGTAISLIDTTGGTIFLAPMHVVPYATGSGVTAQDKLDIAAATITAAQTAPIHANIKQVNNYVVDGQGTDADPWGPV